MRPLPRGKELSNSIPTALKLWHYLGVLLNLAGRPAGSRSGLGKGNAPESHAPGLVLRGGWVTSYRFTNQYDKAIAIMEKGLRFNRTT